MYVWCKVVLDVSVLFNVVTSSLNIKNRRMFYCLIKGYLNKTTKKTLCFIIEENRQIRKEVVSKYTALT